MHKINRAFFFATIRKTIPGFKGRLSQSQISGMSYKLDVWEEKYSNYDDRWLAYCFGTNCIETAWTMLPIKEKGGNAYYVKRYWTNVKIRKQLGNTSSLDAVNFCGKGDVQATGRRNYTRIKELTGIDVVTFPDKMLDPAISAWSMFEGMFNGIYTTRKLSQYFNKTTENWTGARAIINGTDRAKEIASISKEFYKAITYIPA